MIYRKKDLISYVIHNEKVILYGAGKVGNAVVSFLKDLYIKENILAIAITKKEGKEALEEIKIKEIQELVEFKKVPVLIATKNNLFDEIQSKLKYLGFEYIEYIDDELCDELISIVNNKVKQDQVQRCLNQISSQIYNVKADFLKFISKPCIEYMVLNILDHCNLKCKGCDHFACIADPYFVSYDSIYSDLKRMAELLGNTGIIKMGIMGGEPLLHPDLLKILKTVRKFFPNVIIRLTTNGLLLLKQDDDFWKVCRECSVTIVNTKYPINLDFDAMKKKAQSENVKFMYFEDTGEEVVKQSFKKVITLDGNNDPVESFANCHIANYGNFLMEGKFFGCPFSCQSYRIFNKKFGKDLELTSEDYLDIYKISNKQEIFDFAARPKYYCRYCSGLQRGFDWERSKQEITEWIEEEESL